MKRAVVIVLLLGLTVAMTAPVPEASAQRSSDQQQNDVLRNLMEERRIDLPFHDTAFSECVRYIRQRAGINIVLAPRAEEAVGDEPIRLNVRNMRLRHAVDILCDYVELDWCFRHGVVWITDPEDCYAGDTILHIYDVRDITMQIRDFPGARIRLRGNDDGGNPGIIWEEDEPVTEPITIDDLVDIVPEFTGGDTWDLNPNATIMQIAGLLIVRQSLEVHREIAALLNQLRSNR